MRWSNLFVGFLALTFTLHASAGTVGDPRRTLELLNQTREQSQIAPLTESETLDQAAAAKLADMQTREYFAHTSPDGSNPWDFIARAGYSYQFAGENLAMSYPDAETEYQAWMNSPTHCSNMLDSRYTEVGLATGSTVYQGRSVPMTVMLLANGERREQSVSNQQQIAVQCRADTPAPVVLGAYTETDESTGVYQNLYRGAGAALGALIAGVLIARTLYHRSVHRSHLSPGTRAELAAPGLPHSHGSIHIHPTLIPDSSA